MICLSFYIYREQQRKGLVEKHVRAYFLIDVRLNVNTLLCLLKVMVKEFVSHAEHARLLYWLNA